MTSDTQMYKDRCHIFNYFFTNDISVTALCIQYGRSRYPGRIVGMDVFYVGTLKGTGRIYQLIAIDTYSSYAWAKLYTDKSALSACVRLNRTILEEFYQVAFRSKIYESVDELNNGLARFIEYYNCQRAHHGKRTKGKAPAWLYLLHLAA